MNNKSFQQALKLVFAFVLVVSLLLPANSTLALPQKTAPMMEDLIPFEPDDTQYSSQWHYSGTYGINAPEAWGITWDTTAEGGTGGVTAGLGETVVAVLDTGITSHEDLDSTRIKPGYDFVSTAANDNDIDSGGADKKGRDTYPYDPGDFGTCNGTLRNSTWQGTRVAGIIGASSNNATGIAGINWNAKILPVRVIGTCGRAVADDIVDGMRWAVDLPVDGVDNGPMENIYPADVIHVSASIPGTCAAYQTDIDAIIATGAVIVAAAGDNGADAGSNFPANCNGVIAVTATDAGGQRTSTSTSVGSTVKISAPGGGVLSTSRTAPEGPETGIDSYEEMEGTAMAAAHVSGVVSLMFAVNPNLTPASASQFLQRTVKAFPAGSCTTLNCGWGIVDAGKAVGLANMPDLIVTGATLSKIDPSVGEIFQVDVKIKNQGGLNLKELSANSAINSQIYVDRDPSATLTRTIEGCLQTDGSEDLGEFQKQEDSSPIPSGEERILTVDNIQWTDENTPVPWGDAEHKLYVYSDANCIVGESVEDNNQYSTPLTINPFIEGAMLYPKQDQNIGTDNYPTFKWNRVTGATKYRLYLSGPSGRVLDQWYGASQICDTVTPTCSASAGPTLPLKVGNYFWMLMTQSSTGVNSAWSVQTKFKVEVPAVTLEAPIGDIGTNYTPMYTWSKEPTATLYLLLVKIGKVVVLYKSYPAASICSNDTGKCSVQGPTVRAGTHTWQVLAYSPVGYSPWAIGTFNTGIAKPQGVTLEAPAGDIGTNYTPTFTWTKEPTATQYLLYVKFGSAGLHYKLYPAAAICSDVTGKCSMQVPGLTLRAGTHTWQVMAYNPAGYGPWTIGTFNTGTAKPLGVTLEAPVGNIGTNYTPMYTWTKEPTATLYLLLVKGPGGVVLLNKPYPASSICDDVTGKCSVQVPGLTVRAGTHTWQVLTYSPAGYGPWTIGTFNTNTVKPQGVTLEAPVGDIGTNYTPMYTWTKEPSATQYLLLVKIGSAVMLNKLYPASTICSDVTGKCSVQGPTLRAGTHTWQVLTSSPAGYGPWTIGTFNTNTVKPLGVTLEAPAGDIGTNYTPTFTWTKEPTATQYLLYVKFGSAGLHYKLYPAATICSDVTGKCSVQVPGLTVRAGTHTWQVLTSSPAGYGPWTIGTFSTSTVKPLGVTLEAPVGNIGADYTPTFTWAKEPTATQYLLYVKIGKTGLLYKSYPASSICDDVTGKCSVQNPVTLKVGVHVWQVLPYNQAGYGPWSSQVITTTLPGLPAAAELIYPVPDPPNTVENIGTNYNPIYRWNKTDKAFQYLLLVTGPGGAVVLNKWYPATGASGICDATTCSVMSPTLRGGAHVWRVRTFSLSGYGDWTAPTQFSTDVQTIPPAATNLFVNGLPNNNPKEKPIFTWKRVPMSTSYRVYVKGPSGVVLDKFYRSVDVCIGDVCSVASPATLQLAKHTWWVQTYNILGYGPWRSAVFNVEAAPAAATNLLPTGDITDATPTYTWDKVNSATKYHVYVKGLSGVVVQDQWYDSSAICPDTPCSVVSPITLDSGDYIWSVMPYNTSAGYGPWTNVAINVIP